MLINIFDMVYFVVLLAMDHSHNIGHSQTQLKKSMTTIIEIQREHISKCFTHTDTNRNTNWSNIVPCDGSHGKMDGL
jgi:hypothetical protein